VKHFDDSVLDVPGEGPAPGADAGWPALDRLAAGQLSAEEERALRRRAGTDPALARALEAFGPLSGGVRQRLGDAIERRLGARRIPRRALLASAPLLAAAGVVLFIRRRPSGDLPSYDLEVTAGASETRGGTSPHDDVIRGEGFLSLVARPAVRVDRPLAARAFLEATAGWRELASPRLSPSGVVRLAGRLADLLGDVEGPVRIHLVLGAPELIRSRAPLLARGAAPAGPGWQRLTAVLSVSR
jgi:hypothetical protein